MGKNLNRKVTIYINGTEIKSTIASLEAELKKLKNQQKQLTIGTEEYVETGKKIREIENILHSQRAATHSLNSEWKSTTERVAEAANVLMGFQSAMQMIDLGVGKIKDLAKDAAALDDVYADVMKTTGLTHEEVQKLNETFKKMDTRTGREELNKLAYEAGKLGINSTEAVAGFVSAADKINIALGDVLGEGAMVTIGKLSEVYAKSTHQLAENSGDIEKQMLAIGSAINMLGQSSTANENYLVDFLGRLGGVATQAGLSADQILGFASALDQDMQKVEMSATAFQRLIGQMIKKPQEFLAAAKMPLSEFKELMEKDMNGAILRVLKGFNEMGGYTALVPVFQDMGLDGQRAAAAISAMASSLDKVTTAQAIANEELTTGNSVIKEFNTKNENMQAKAEKAKKRFEEIRIELGNELYPILIHLQTSGTVLMKGVSGFVQLIKENKAILPGLVALMANWLRVKLLNMAADGKLASSLKSLLGIEKLKAHHTDVLTAKTLKKTAAEEQERLMTIKNQLAIERENLARQKSKVGMEAQSLVVVAETRVKQLETAATNQATVAANAHTTSIKAQKAAFASTPWGLIITALTTIAGVVYNIWKNSEKVKLAELMKEVSKQAGEAEGNVKVLFERLKDAAEGSEQYRSALEALKSEYPNIISKHIDEKGALKDIEQAYKDVSSAAVQSAYDRMYADKVAEQSGNVAETVAKKTQDIYRILTGETSSLHIKWSRSLSEAVKNEVQRMVGDVTQQLSKGEIGLNEAAEQIDSIVKKFGGSWTGYNQSRGASGAQMIAADLRGISEAAKKSNEYLKELGRILNAEPEDTFGIQKMSLEELESELKKYLDMMEHGFSEGAERDAARLKAYRDQIAKLKKEQQTDTTTTTTTVTEETEEEQKRLAKEREREQKELDRFIQKQQGELAKLRKKLAGTEDESKLSEAEKAAKRLVEQLREIDEKMANLDVELENATPEQIEQVRKLALQYQILREEIVRAGEAAIESGRQQDVQNKMQRAADEAFANIQEIIENIDLRSPFEKWLEDDLGEWCERKLDTIEKFASQATSIFRSVNTILDNIGDQELVEMRRRNEEETATLDEQLEQQLISQEEYNQRKKEMDDEYNDKENEIRKEQWVRNKWLSAGEAVIEGALAVLKALNDKTIPSTAARIAMAATIGTLTAAQILAITSQPEPYAKGGYVPKRTVYQAGEAGPEWVASNSLLTDPVAAPIIEQLEAYQRGNRRALADIPMAQLNMPVATQAARELGRRSSLSEGRLSEALPAISPNVSVTMPGNEEVVQLWRELATYLKDPKNRQAVISRQTMKDFDNLESFLRSRARL